uniref:Uncharacterized protein n=1 Tax=Romanomermis culicivorax TaxID=13658 RepID=A0A915JC14_ROMCU
MSVMIIDNGSEDVAMCFHFQKDIQALAKCKGQGVIVRTDHKPLQWLKDGKHRNTRLQWFSLQDYDYKTWMPQILTT